jgi:hypothetical protein
VDLDHEEHHGPHRAQHAQRLDAEEIARVQRLPVALEKLLLGPPAHAFRRRLHASFFQQARNRRPADLDLQAAQGVADLGVSPARIPKPASPKGDLSRATLHLPLVS